MTLSPNLLLLQRPSTNHRLSNSSRIAVRPASLVENALLPLSDVAIDPIVFHALAQVDPGLPQSSPILLLFARSSPSLIVGNSHFSYLATYLAIELFAPTAESFVLL